MVRVDLPMPALANRRTNAGTGCVVAAQSSWEHAEPLEAESLPSRRESNPSRDQAQENECLYCSKRPSVNQFKGGLGIFAGKWDCGCPGTTSAIDLLMLASTGVARKA